MKPAFAVMGMLLTALQAGCSTDLDKRYLDANTSEELALPPDLTASRSESSFKLPEGFSEEAGLKDGEVPVLARVDSLKLEGYAGFYWLSVEEPVESLYQQVKAFWEFEGFRLEKDEPAIGMMQTEWIFNEEGTEAGSSYFFGLFKNNDLSATQDQFKTRIERDPETQQSRVYIAHRGTALKYEINSGEGNAEADIDDNQWSFRQPEPALEIEMLSRLMIYLGLEQATVEQQVEDVKLFAPRALKRFDSEENAPYLLLEDPYRRAFNRVHHQLERMNFEIANLNYDSSLFTEGTITVTLDVVEEADDGGLFSFFSSSSLSAGQVVLVISEESKDTTRVTLETYQGDIDTSAEGAEFLNLLYLHLK